MRATARSFAPILSKSINIFLWMLTIWTINTWFLQIWKPKFSAKQHFIFITNERWKSISYSCSLQTKQLWLLSHKAINNKSRRLTSYPEMTSADMDFECDIKSNPNLVNIFLYFHYHALVHGTFASRHFPVTKTNKQTNGFFFGGPFAIKYELVVASNCLNCNFLFMPWIIFSPKFILRWKTKAAKNYIQYTILD